MSDECRKARPQSGQKILQIASGVSRRDARALCHIGEVRYKQFRKEYRREEQYYRLTHPSIARYDWWGQPDTTVYCPNCGAPQDGADGFGVIFCEACGYLAGGGPQVGDSRPAPLEMGE